MTITLMAHQEKMVQHMEDNPRAHNLSGCGTGKTIPTLHYALENNLRTLILCPLSIVQAAWINDLKKMGHEDAGIAALASNRADAFARQSPITVANFEAVNWMARKPNQKYYDQFDLVVTDEFEAFANARAARSKNAGPLYDRTERGVMMSGTPFGKTVENVWYPTKLLDGGQRLGKFVSHFRFAYRTPTVIPGAPPGAIKWMDKEGALDTVAGLIADISIRFSLDECEDIPPNKITWVGHPLSAAGEKAYKEMMKAAVTELSDGSLLKGVNAAVAQQKALQIASGSAYDQSGARAEVDTTRNKLVTELIAEREHSVVFFTWTHQRHGLEESLKKRKISYAVIDGSVPARMRGTIVEEYQNGKYQTLLLQSASASHGITLTRATAAIFTTPPRGRPTLLTQGIARIRRKGQTQKTETLFVYAEGTFETRIYQALLDEVDQGQAFVDYVKSLTE